MNGKTQRIDDSEPQLGAAGMAAMLRRGETTSLGLVEAALKRINDHDAAIGAFTHVDAEGARDAAHKADRERADGKACGPLHGIPYALKDNYDAAGMATTCGSRLRLDHRARADSEVAARFRKAGAILLGKLATFEFALGGPSFDLPFPPTRNPWNRAHIAGGSSSGSGAAIAAGFVPIAMGTCTTGSIRGPAAWCGTIGLKPTFGRVSRRGVFPLAPSLDHCGPLARSVRDAASALQVIAGHDPGDPDSMNVAIGDYAAGLEDGVGGMRVGVPRAFFEHAPALSSEARAGIEDALRILRQEGCEVRDVDLPDLDLFLACGRVLMAAEAFAIHRKDLRERIHDYDAVTARRFATGAMVTAADYIDAKGLQKTLRRSIDAALEEVDMLVTAVSLDTAPRLETSSGTSAWPLQCSPFNVTGHPAIAVPTGLARDGLPLSVQIVGRPFAEATILQCARVVERSCGWASVALPDPPAEAA